MRSLSCDWRSSGTIARRSIDVIGATVLAAAPDLTVPLAGGVPALAAAAPLAGRGGLPATTVFAGTGARPDAATLAAGALLAAACALAARRTRACAEVFAAAFFTARLARTLP